MPRTSDTLRDRTRDTDHKTRAMTRRNERIGKSARLFLSFAFPAGFGSAGA